MDWLLDNWFFSRILRPGLDIFFLAFIIYKCYQIIVQTRAIQLIKGGFLLLVIYGFTFFLKLQTLSWILQMILPSIIIFVIIIFQPELRKIFTKMGQDKWFKLTSIGKKYQFESVFSTLEVLSEQKRGGIIVFMRNVGLKNIIETGTMIDAALSTSLLLTIFNPNSPLHDGAVIIKEDRMVAAGCFLPLSEQTDIRKSFGTRHRAALGLAEETDAVVLVASEETGAISLAYDANLLYDLSIEEISKKVKQLFEYTPENDEDTEEEHSLEI